MNKRKLLKSTGPAILTLWSGSVVARSSISCDEDPNSWTTHQNQTRYWEDNKVKTKMVRTRGLTKSCYASIYGNGLQNL